MCDVISVYGDISVADVENEITVAINLILLQKRLAHIVSLV